MKSRCPTFSVMIYIFCLTAIAIGLMFIFGYQQPTNLMHQTGYILSFEQRDEKWYDSFFDTSAGSYFYIWLEDNSYYEATGICYDNINRNLFEKIHVGESITITYVEKSGGLRKIYAVEYMGETYLSLNDVLNELSENEKTANNAGLMIIVLSILTGVISIGLKKNREHSD